MRRGTYQHHNLPYEVISAAVSGDPEAMAVVQNHYKEYIAKLATSVRYDCHGSRYTCLNENLRQRLECKLVTVTMRFHLD